MQMKTTGDKIFDIVNYTILGIVLILVIYPLYFIIIASFSDPDAVNCGQVWLIPKGFTIDGYASVFKDPLIMTGYKNSLIYVVLGTSINVVITLMAAYPLSRKDLVGRNFFMFLFTFTMFFGGGLIPRYLLVKQLGLLNKIWALIIPNAVGVWNIIIARTFFQSNIPNELLEAAVIDGCSNTKFFVKIVLPLSKALTAIMVLFYGVGHWNAFFDAMIFLNDKKLYPLQLVLRNILIQNTASFDMMVDADTLAAQSRLSEIIKYALIIVASVPVLLIYPFIQKYFVKGVMIGSLKG